MKSIPRAIKYVSDHLNRDPAYNKIFFIYRENLLATSES